MREVHRSGWIARSVAAIGAQFIYFLIWVFGRSYRRADIEWLAGPLGGKVIGDAPYQEVAIAEQLAIERDSQTCGLIPNFDQLGGADFDASRIHPGVRDFYEHTAEFAIDVWSRSYFPANVALALLVTTVSRQVNQLNFPLSPLDTALGMKSEIIATRTRDGVLKYAGWCRSLTPTAGRNT